MFTQIINGVAREGFALQYQVSLVSLAAKGNLALQGPLAFVDRLNTWPGAMMLGCRRADGNDGFPAQPGTLTCEPRGTVQGADGFAMSISKIVAGNFASTTYVATMFVPAEDVYRTAQPGWAAG